MTGNPFRFGPLVITAFAMAPCIPSATGCVNSTEIRSNPAAWSPASYSLFEKAPAMHQTWPADR